MAAELWNLTQSGHYLNVSAERARQVWPTTIRRSRRRRLNIRAEAPALGCRAAASALEARDDDDVIHAVISSHAHDERCGGRYFPDDPKP